MVVTLTKATAKFDKRIPAQAAGQLQQLCSMQWARQNARKTGGSPSRAFAAVSTRKPFHGSVRRNLRRRPRSNVRKAVIKIRSRLKAVIDLSTIN